MTCLVRVLTEIRGGLDLDSHEEVTEIIQNHERNLDNFPPNKHRQCPTGKEKVSNED